MKLLIEKYKFVLINSFKKGFVHLISANLLIQVFSFASQLFVAGILSPEDIGRIKIIQTYLSLFSIIAGWGFNSSTLKLCSENRSNKEKYVIFSSAIFFTLISTSFIYLIILLFNQFKLFSSDTLITWLIPVGLFPLISNSVFIVYIAYFQSNKLIKRMSALTISNKLISIILIILFTYIAGIKGYYFAYNISFILIIFVAIKYLKPSFRIKNIKSYLQLHNRYAIPSFTSTFFAELSAYVDILLLNFMLTDLNEIGMYGFALTLTIIFKIFPSSVQQITIPYFSENSTNKPKFHELFKYYNKILHIVVLIIYIIAILVVPSFISIIFKQKYDSSIPYFYILGLGWSIRMLVQLRSGAIFGLGKVKYNLYVSIISSTFNIFLFYFSLKYWGIYGLAISNIFSGLLIYLLSYIFYNKALE
ncbi:MAG: oligosaccharide flippase family protein [Paludibacter sp.]|nr:oligosaccharide flippase family protein [Paludibacter sp.]